jgi:hypothetical protein
MEVPELRNFTQNLREAMKDDQLLDEFDRVCLENYIESLQFTYLEWKRRNVSQSTPRRASLTGLEKELHHG